MSIKATCPDCGHNAAFNDATAGKKAKCHQCGALFFLPADGGSPKPRQMTTPTAKSKPKSLPPITNQEMDWESISKLEREGDTVQRPPQASRGEDHESEQSGVTSPKRHKRATASIQICLPSHKAGRKRATTFSDLTPVGELTDTGRLEFNGSLVTVICYIPRFLKKPENRIIATIPLSSQNPVSVDEPSFSNKLNKFWSTYTVGVLASVYGVGFLLHIRFPVIPLYGFLLIVGIPLLILFFLASLVGSLVPITRVTVVGEHGTKHVFKVRNSFRSQYSSVRKQLIKAGYLKPARPARIKVVDR